MKLSSLFGGKTLDLPGKLFVIEGPDGCGKGTQIKWLVRELRKGYPDREVVVTHEPWDEPESPDGMRIRRVLKHQETEIDPGDGHIDSKKFQKLYVGDRYLHWAILIVRKLSEGAIVICDRERMSTYAYGYAFGLDVDEIHSWHVLFPIPDKFIFLDAPAAICSERLVKRAAKRGEELEFFETTEKIKKVVGAYRHIRDTGLLPIVSVDGTGHPKQVFTRVLSEVLAGLPA